MPVSRLVLITRCSFMPRNLTGDAGPGLAYPANHLNAASADVVNLAITTGEREAVVVVVPRLNGQLVLQHRKAVRDVRLVLWRPR